MDAEWFKSPTARRILAHWTDARPAWLWSGDGRTLLWRNNAARLFHGKLKKSGIKLAADAIPIPGQVARLLRLGSRDRPSLSRIQFLAGKRPLAATCSVTPLQLPNQIALLVVGVDPVAPELFAALDEDETLASDPVGTAMFPAGAEYLVLSPDGGVRNGTPLAVEHLAPQFEDAGLPQLDDSDSAEVELDGNALTLIRYPAADNDSLLLLLPQQELAPDIDVVRAEEGLADFTPAPDDERTLPVGLAPANHAVESPDTGATEPQTADAERRSLSSLFDRLADHDELYGELPAEPELPTEAEPTPDQDASDDVIAAMIELAEDVEDDPVPLRYRVIGRGFRRSTDAEAPEPAAEQPPSTPIEVVERVSRYNFDELSRILADRVSGEDTPADTTPTEGEAAAPAPLRTRPASEGALINIAAETFILNRLPLGIMVFRDQQVLFANRALTDLTGYDSIEGLRTAGLGAIFPQDAVSAGPVTHLLRRDGSQLPVAARLQSITWHGRPALMLSANLSQAAFGHEGAVRTFAETLAQAGEEGFVTADRAGVLTLASLRAGVLIGRPEADIIGQPLTTLIDPRDGAALRNFLEQPARFAETSRPSLALRGVTPDLGVVLFAEGQAGIVTGYFGFIRRQRSSMLAANAADEGIEPSMLARVGRGVRRPLNTIIGFADLIRSSAFGAIENQRYLEYARDIKTAGQEIAVLVDELDDFARLRDGRFPTRPAELDLGGLLESCVVRVRGQASAARVLVRSGISERLPRIRADRASLGQAVLNLLASAIDQTPAGGSVILSAQPEENGNITINIRDSGGGKVDLGERFVVFRDGVGREGEALAPVRSSVGLALTRALLAVNACTLSVDPSGGVGTIFSLVVPADLIAERVTTA